MSSPFDFLGSVSPWLIAAHQHPHWFPPTTTTIQAILALVAGVLAIIRPKNLNLIVAGYLLVVGVVQLFQFSF